VGEGGSQTKKEEREKTKKREEMTRGLKTKFSTKTVPRRDPTFQGLKSADSDQEGRRLSGREKKFKKTERDRARKRIENKLHLFLSDII